MSDNHPHEMEVLPPERPKFLFLDEVARFPSSYLNVIDIKSSKPEPDTVMAAAMEQMHKSILKDLSI